MHDVSLLADAIPPTAELRKRLALLLTEASLIKSLIRLAMRRERDEQRLARVAQMLDAEGAALVA